MASEEREHETGKRSVEKRAECCTREIEMRSRLRVECSKLMGDNKTKMRLEIDSNGRTDRRTSGRAKCVEEIEMLFLGKGQLPSCGQVERDIVTPASAPFALATEEELVCL